MREVWNRGEKVGSLQVCSGDQGEAILACVGSLGEPERGKPERIGWNPGIKRWSWRGPAGSPGPVFYLQWAYLRVRVWLRSSKSLVRGSAHCVFFDKLHTISDLDPSYV